MRFVIQRVQNASVAVDNSEISSINKGLLVFIGIGADDSTQEADWLINKLIHLRIFEDEAGKTNLSLSDVAGSLLLISQFTLYANCQKGNRPSFTEAAKPQQAEQLYEYTICECKKLVPVVETGVFGADMKISLTNDGPFTILLEK